MEIVDLDSIPKSPSVRYGHTSEIVVGRLYLFGGSNGKIFYNELHIFNLKTMKWEGFYEASKEIDGRNFHSCVFDGEKDLVFFGGKSNGYKNDLVAFDIEKKEFRIIQPVFRNDDLQSCVNRDILPPSPRYGHSSCYYLNKMYIFGGYDHNGWTKNELYRFDFETRMWRRFLIPRMEFRYHHSGVLTKSDGNYYIIGGLKKNNEVLSDVFRLDLNSSIETQSELSEIDAFQITVENPIQSYGHKCFLLDNRIFMYGGRGARREEEYKSIVQLLPHEGNFRWAKVGDFPFDPSKLLLSYGTINIYEKRLLFFGGQKRKTKKDTISRLRKEEEEKEEEKRKRMKTVEDLSYDELFHILSFLTHREYLILGSSICKKPEQRHFHLSVAARSDRYWKKKYDVEYNRSMSSSSSSVLLGSYHWKKIRRESSLFGRWRQLKIQKHEKRRHDEEMRRRSQLKRQKQEEKERKKQQKREVKKLVKKQKHHHLDGLIFESLDDGSYYGMRSKRRQMTTTEVSNRQKLENIPRIKVVFTGDGAVGKSCLVIRMSTGFYPEEYVPTVYDNYPINVIQRGPQNNNNLLISRLDIWDTATEEYSSRIGRLWFPDMNVCCLCFSIIDETSLINLRVMWLREIKELVPKMDEVAFLLVGTKLDLRDDPKTMKEMKEYDLKQVSKESALKAVEEMGLDGYVETSAKTGENCAAGELQEAIMKVYHKKLGGRGVQKGDKCGIM